LKPYCTVGDVSIYQADALDLLRSLPDASVQLIATDPPYFRVKDEAWDRVWKSDREFLRWIGSLCREWQRVLAPNGSLYVFASPDMALGVERMVGRFFNVLNSIRWEKAEGWHQKAEKETLRSYLSPWEACVFAEQHGCEYEDAALALHKQVYAPVGRVVAEMRIAAGFARHEVDTACSPSRKPTGLCYRWEEGACLPTEEQFVALCRLCGVEGDYEALREQYEALREQYEALRRPFELTAAGQWSDLWRFPTVSPYPGKHPCEKPLAMMEHIVRTSSRSGDVVLDTFCGSGATAEAARNLGRRAIVGDMDPHWCAWTARRLSQENLFAALDGAA
jgi:adenine-specific DNA-methyltransferase